MNHFNKYTVMIEGYNQQIGKDDKAMKRSVLLLAVIIFFFYSCVQNVFLNQDYRSFNKDPNSGWRKVAQEEGFAEAGDLIDRYLKKHKDLGSSQTVNLNFHAGQMFAFANNYETALERFKNAKYDPEPEGIPIRWNAYVDSTIAFLKKDKIKLLECRNQIANGPKISGKIPNLDVVDSLIKNFDKPYFEAYMAHRRRTKRR